MSGEGLSYFQQVQGGIYGTPDAGDPVARAQLQAEYANLEESFTTKIGYVPPSYFSTASGNLPTIGWTVQNQRGGPSAFPPYDPNVGTIPDWTSDVNPIGAGTYDMNQTWGAMAPNPLNQGPIGDGVLQGMDGQPPDPNHLPQDVGGSIGGFNEY